MKRKFNKILVLLSVSVLVVLGCCGWTVNAQTGEATISGQATIKHNGKVSAVLTIESEETSEVFNRRLNRRIEGYNKNSGDDDFVTISEVTAIENGYKVKLEFRRIDKVKAMGDFDWKPLSAFVSFADNRKLIEDYQKGNWSNTWSVYYEGKGGGVQLAKKGEGQTEICPYSIEGEKQDVNKLLSYAVKAEDSEKMFLFRMVDVGKMTSLRISFPDTIRYYAGNNVVLIGDDTLEIKPTEARAASITRYVAETDETGKEEIVKEVLSDEPIQVMLGYVIYDQSMSPLAVAGIMAGIVIGVGTVIGLVVCLVLKGRKEKKLHPSDAKKDKNAFVVGLRSAFQSKVWKNIVKNRWLYLIILPAVVLVGIFCYLPMAGVLIAFQDFDLLEGVGGSEWIGLKAFEQVFVNPTTANYMAVRNTIYIALIRIASNFPIILVFALLLREIKSRKARSAIQSISYIPYFISWVAVGGLANNLFTQDGGVLNNLLNMLGMESVSWYNEPRYWWAILALSSLWKGMGWATLIYMSAMGSINDELYDACRIDGGGRFRQMITVTLPGISNVIMLQLLLDVASIVRDDADQIMAMTNNSPALDNTTAVIGTTLISTITGGGNYASATALGIVQGLVGLALVLIMNSVVKKTENEGLL